MFKCGIEVFVELWTLFLFTFKLKKIYMDNFIMVECVMFRMVPFKN